MLPTYKSIVVDVYSFLPLVLLVHMLEEYLEISVGKKIELFKG